LGIFKNSYVIILKYRVSLQPHVNFRSKILRLDCVHYLYKRMLIGVLLLYMYLLYNK